MIIKQSEFSVSAVKASQYPEGGLDEIALAGRSNVGKSSFINTLLQRKNLARTSSSPGKTQTLNFYRVDSDQADFYLVDVPGYGYAKVSKKQREEFGEMIQDYLETRAYLKGLILLIDGRHEPTADDIAMYDYAQYLNLPILLVATKMDKIKKNAFNKTEAAFRKHLNLNKDNVTFLPFSSVTKLNVDQVKDWIQARLDEE
ncbi:ribosome biogenesis GTP-binding protein YihA/YsxC [Lactobacillus delbrueckii]|jgi:GTP-binding protein|uniref:ribosome biogenesis GTP-binding protein YihA/YsxC n=1 Tax=Lactobacillus delbrueckii TaxID=1584 RepID=UPI00068294A4|nr:ribosome biogenesis GTP-binding protein YihA/YsxC [Lactobacillus delbrueckii]APG74515.1 YihA family ribosome biogenesis GTP-binding protein [Lactobacillus delbrueckii subsp. sunkii]ARR38243.1 GTP-binding protein [Lactobacillus delbrueckii subsp. delbrueckii]KNE74753.1 GTP-binding protein EngB [Lactobacillus delbrueckii subsp. sunkii]MDK8261378.1 ribosome biogenesis GTP-binding protein YihA/YsxC [Lactobacillus delbrueckii]GHN12626.1 GTP-binding protein [Lactobacillus delbrueckii subsp. sunki